MSDREFVALGTSSLVPTKTRNHNGYLLRWGASGVLFDCGEGTQRQMTRAGVSARSIMETPSVHSRFAEHQQQLQQLQGEAQNLQNTTNDQNQSLEALKARLEALQAAEQKARDELVALQRASGNAIAIDQRNRELQAAVVNLEQENLSLKHRNTRLEESLNQKQLYVGGFLVFAGFILHWLSGLFRLGQRRRSSFDDL